MLSPELDNWYEMPVLKGYFERLLEDLNARRQGFKYEGLLGLLFETRFYPVLEKDKNREEDALDLRAEYIDSEACRLIGMVSVLEVLIALAKRVDEDNWRILFWSWLWNLGLSDMVDHVVCEEDVMNEFHHKIDTWLSREFSNESGSPWPLFGYDGDASSLEMWFQVQQWDLQGRRCICAPTGGFYVA